MEVCEAVSPLVSGLDAIQNNLDSTVLDSVFAEAIDGHAVPTTALPPAVGQRVQTYR